jgi:GNAT superfamily N-acetyltransferase
MPAIQVRSLDPADRRASVDVLMDAFPRDPWMEFCFLADEPGYAERMRGYCEAGHHWHTTLGFPVYAAYADGRLVGVAYVMGPNPVVPDEPGLLPAMREACGEAAVDRFARCNEATDAEMPDAPAHCVALIAVLSKNQGEGIGGRLLEQVITDAEADPDSHGVVLETGNPNNLAFYGRYDFEVVGEARVENLDLHVLFHPCRKGAKA